MGIGKVVIGGFVFFMIFYLFFIPLCGFTDKVNPLESTPTGNSLSGEPHAPYVTSGSESSNGGEHEYHSISTNVEDDSNVYERG